MDVSLVAGIMIPFAGTTLGSAMVFLMRRQISRQIEKLLLGFAAGVMIAASVWSLLIPAIEMASAQGVTAAAAGLLLGIVFLLFLDRMIVRLHSDITESKNMRSNAKNTAMMVFAVTLHNIPEGMAVGVTFAGALLQNAQITMAGAFTLALGIAIQNFPEGAIISMPLRSEGRSRKRAFVYGMLSGIVEPAGAVLTILLAKQIVPILPYFLSFAAGAMIYVVVEELIPESQQDDHTHIGTIGAAVGFVIMMILDVALG